MCRLTLVSDVSIVSKCHNVSIDTGVKISSRGSRRVGTFGSNTEVKAGGGEGLRCGGRWGGGGECSLEAPANLLP